MPNLTVPSSSTRHQVSDYDKIVGTHSVYAPPLKEGAIDWRTGEAADMNLYFDEAIDIHHIFPKAWCEKQKIKPQVYNSIVNKTR